MINQNRQQKFKYKKNGKKLIKKVTAFLLTFTILVTGLPMREISELTSRISFASLISCVSQLDFINSIQSVLPDFKDRDGFHGILFSEPELSASAEEAVENTDREATTINITSKDELIAYANGTFTDSNGVSGYRHDDKLNIAFNTDELIITDEDNFLGIGTSSAPFAGTIKILNVREDDLYGDLKKLSLNNVSLFNYISTNTRFINSSDESTPLLLNVGDSGTVPLFAKNVTTGDNPQEWNIVVKANNFQTGGLIGCNNGNAKLNVSYLSSGAVNNDSDAGAICGKIEAYSSLELSVESAELGDVTGTTNAGGLIGSMESGATLTIKELPELNTSRNITASNGYAGGLVGNCNGGTIIFSEGVNYNDTASNMITGTSGAGGVFGYYGVAENSVEINSSVYTTSGGTITASNGSAGGLIGFLENKGEANTPSITISGGNINSTLNSKYSGGLIGKYACSNLADTLIIKYVTTESSRTSGTYGGLIGYMENAYVRTEGNNSISVSSEGGNSGGLVGQIKNSFLDVAGENTISGNKIQAGILHTMEGDSVIRFSGITDVSGANITQANLIQNRNNSLIYALGSGNDYQTTTINEETGETTVSGWSYYRPDKPTSTLEDVNAWGQVVRLVNNQTLEEAGVVTVDTAHTVTLNGISPSEDNIISIANSADFAKVALNVKLNDKEKTAGALRTSSIYINSTVLNNTNITLELTGNVDLSGTGITGFTKDYESDRKGKSFLGKFNGNNWTITIANGETYGFRGTVNLTEADLSDSSKWGNTGAVVTHRYSSLFSDIGHLTDRDHKTKVKNLNINGNVRIFANGELKIGGIASQMIGNTELDNVSVTAKFTYYGFSEQTSGVGRFFGMDDDWGVMDENNRTSTKTLQINNCISGGIIDISGKLNLNNYSLGTFGTISRIEDATDIIVNGLIIKGSIETNATTKSNEDFCTFGGFIGVVFCKDDNNFRPDQIFELNNLTINDFKINSTSNYEHCGGLLGGIWRGVNVIVDNVEVTNDSKITLGANKNQTVGGLVTQATGYWHVKNLKYTDFEITSTNTPNTIGLIVGEGWEPDSAKYSIDTNRLYLEIASPDAYTIGTVNLPIDCTTFDELVGKTIKGDDLESNGQGFVSIHTSNDKLNMTTDSGNEYTPKTELGQIKVNPYTRYYYNLDYLLTNANIGGEKFLLWSVYNYAAPNIQSNTNLTNKIKGNNKNSFDDYSELPTELAINLENLSYYPIDVSSPVSLTDKTIKLNNSAMEQAHGTTYSTRAYSQHYLMHCGLFRNVSSSLSLENCTLSGTASAYQNSLKSATSEQNYQGSGALVCGKIEGTIDAKANLNVNGLTLSNLTIANFNENGIGTTGIGLLVRNIGSYSNTAISNVTTEKYEDNVKAAHALINQAGSATVSQMSISFSDMCLDSRADSSQGDSNFNTAYNTTQSIFTKATLINTLQYNASTSGSSAIYNYNYNDDWRESGTALHHLTYGKEISNSAEYNHEDPNTDPNDYQTRYLDMHAKDDTNHYTSWESKSAVEVGDFSAFLPYVGTAYNADSNYHEIAVNHISIEIKEGCGTYNDPYIIDDGATLSTVAKVINSGTFGKGFSLYIDNDYLTGFDVNFEKWDNSKSAGTGHTRFEYDGSKFVCMKNVNGEWVIDTSYTGKIPTADQVRSYLAGAYYQITGTAENQNTITLSNSYLGFGAENSDYAFRGVIIGKSTDGSKMTIENQSEAPFIKVSNGCVVKDININITANTITLTNSNISTAAKFDYNSGCKYYGGIIGEIMGGDSVIDGVQVTFGETADKTTEIKIVSGANDSNNAYKYTQIVPVGGYVGVVVYGGLIFRNMGTQSISTIGKLTVNSYKYDGTTSIWTNAMDETNMAHLYVNPIVGRVVNAYVINETSGYNYTNGKAALKNSTKNYAIPDINASSVAKITFTKTDSENDTINVLDGQSLFVLSLITQSMCGNATSATGEYKTKYSYGEGTKTTHLAQYSDVGTDELSKSDFSEFATNDKIGVSNAVPYLIARYTEKTNDNNYPARTITGKNTNYHYMKLTGNSDYNLPECFRGIGLVYSLGSDDNVRHNLMDLYGLDGNGKTINLNTKFYNKSCVFDPYYKNSSDTNAYNIGLGLFNDLYADIPNKTTVTETSRSKHSDYVIKDTKNSLYNFKLSGKIEHFQYDNNEKSNVTSNKDNTNKQRASTGGLIGNLIYSGERTGRVYNIWNVSLNNLDIKCDGRAGGFFGKLPNKELYIYINNCNADNVNLETSFNDAGVIVGNTENNIRIYVNTFNDETNDFKVSVKSADYFACGGLIGYTNANYMTLRNINVIGCGDDKRIGIKDKEKNTVENNHVGGAIGYIKGGNVLLDNVNVYGMNIYGGHSGGIVGSMDSSPTLRIYNCGVHGKSVDKVKIDDNETYYIEGYRQAGGIVGYAYAKGSGTLKMGEASYTNDFDGCYVNNYTIQQYQNAESASAGGIIACNDNNRTRVIANSMVSDCTIACNGQGENRGMGGIIGWTKGNNGIGLQCYNIVVNNITFDTTAAADTTTYTTNGVAYPRVKSHYGLFCGCAKDSPMIKLVGYTVQGTNTINVAFYDKLTTCPRNVEFDLGRSYSGDLTSVIPSVYNSSSYIIYADYDGTCLSTETQYDKFSDIKLDSVTNVSRAASDDDNFPYVTSSPFHTFGTNGEFLTGDGVSRLGSTCANIIAQYNNSTYGAKQYKNITPEDVTAYNQLIGKLVTDDETLPNVPVIVMDDTMFDYDKAIKAYLRILTNTTYKFDGSDETGIYNIDILSCNTNGAEPTISKTLHYTGGKFSMDKSNFDSNTAGQFSLIDVQFFAPNDTTKVAYHLYVPVITKKLYYYGFKTTVFSGTQYYESKYTDDNGFIGNTPKVLMENYGTPVTQYLRWTYPTNTLVSDVLAGGFGLDWNYKKDIKITVSYGGKIPAGSKLVLIDKNNQNKEYYYTVSGKETYNGQTLTLDFDSFKDINGEKPNIVNFQSLVTEQLTFKKSDINTEEQGTFVEDSENGTFTLKINGQDTKVRLANDTDTDTFNLSVEQTEMYEDYYLTIYSEEDKETLYHQLQITSANPLTPNKTGKISSSGQKLNSVQINLANLFSNKISVTTVDNDTNTNIEMNDIKNDVNVHVTSVIKFNYTSLEELNNLKGLLTANSIPIYHSTHVYMNKRSTNNGAAEKMIGDIDSIEIISNNNTITAYSTYYEYGSTENEQISTPSQLFYSDVNGESVTNFFEVREMNEGNEINIADYLTSGGKDVAPTVVVDSCFKIKYSHAGIIVQFPEREKSDGETNIGTYVTARSSLAYSPSDTTYSSSISEIAQDSINRLYYRYQMTDADLKFNVYHTDIDNSEEVSGDIITKANDQLGINIFDSGTDNNSVIQTKGIFDVSQLSALEKNKLNVRWTIELRCKQDNYSDDKDLKLLDYLNGITVKDVDENTLATLTNSSAAGIMQNDGNKWYYQAERSKFEEIDNPGLFDIYLDFDIKTGADLQAVANAFYSNYKIVLTATLCEGSSPIDGTSDDDYLIYTNARLDPTFVNMP